MVKTVFFGLFQTLGDIIASTALIRAIKEKYPDSKITYAVGAQYTDILAGNPDIFETIACGSAAEIILRASEKPYDKVMIPLMLTSEDTLWHQRYPWCVPGEKRNLVDMYAERCQDDITVNKRKTFIYPTENHWQEIVSQIPADKKEDFLRRPYITVHTTSRLESKDWPWEKFAELATRIFNHFEGKLYVYQVGGPEDRVLPNPCAPLTGVPILYTASLIQHGLMHIDVDSGPSFIADSLDIPTVCIMGATNPSIAGPIGPSTTFIEPNGRKCIGTATHTVCVTHCLIKDDCIKTISVDDVFNHVVERLTPILKENGIIA